MGLLLIQQVADDCQLGLWEINEDFDTLFSKLNLSVQDRNTLDNFQSYQRKLEWLSVRVLICEVLKKECQIIYNAERKPFLADGSHNISISHSGNLTSVLLSKKFRVGIDLELMSHKIHNIAHKFISEKEIICCDPEFERLHLYIHWCAKEALYKICDKQDINFKQNLSILPFEPKECGEITGFVHNIHVNEQYSMKYFLWKDYVIVWCNK